MKYLPKLTFREGMQIGVSLGTAIFIFMTGTFLVSALTGSLVGIHANNGGIVPASVTPDTWRRRLVSEDVVKFDAVASPQEIADTDAVRALEATRWMVFQELQKTIRHSLPAVVADATPPARHNTDYLRVVVDSNGASTAYTNREVTYKELKSNVDKMLDRRLQERLQEILGNNYELRFPEEDMQLTVNDNAAVALAATNRDVIKNLRQSVRHMILSPLGSDGVMEIARRGQESNKPATRTGDPSPYTRVSWNITDE